MNAETMEEKQIPNFRMRIEEYWETHTVRPDTAREVLTVKRPDNYRPLWGRLPSSEAQALYILDLLGYLSYWRPRYTINEVVRVYNNIILRTERNVDNDKIRQAPRNDRRTVAQSSLQRIAAAPPGHIAETPVHWSTMVQQADNDDKELPSVQGTN
jgi:hypothetical protein